MAGYTAAMSCNSLSFSYNRLISDFQGSCCVVTFQRAQQQTPIGEEVERKKILITRTRCVSAPFSRSDEHVKHFKPIRLVYFR